MSETKEEKDIKDKVLEAIRRGGVKMRPRWHFILGGALFLLGASIVLLVLLYLSGFILFSMQQEGSWFVPIFGWEGTFAFLRSLPLLLIGLAILFIVILEILVSRYPFAYRKPLMYSASAIIILVLAGGAAVAPLHRQFFRFDRENRLPPMMSGFYRNFGPRHSGDMHRGEITENSANGFLMQDVFGGTSTVVISARTRLPIGADFTPGDTVVVFGNKDENGKIEAWGVREISDSDFDFGMRGRMMLPPLSTSSLK